MTDKMDVIATVVLETQTAISLDNRCMGVNKTHWDVTMKDNALNPLPCRQKSGAALLQSMRQVTVVTATVAHMILTAITHSSPSQAAQRTLKAAAPRENASCRLVFLTAPAKNVVGMVAADSAAFVNSMKHARTETALLILTRFQLAGCAMQNAMIRWTGATANAEHMTPTAMIRAPLCSAVLRMRWPAISMAHASSKTLRSPVGPAHPAITMHKMAVIAVADSTIQIAI